MRVADEPRACGSTVRLTQLLDVLARAKIIANAQVAEAAGADDQTENYGRVFRRVVTPADIALRVDPRGAKQQEQGEGKKSCKFFQDTSPKYFSCNRVAFQACSPSPSIERDVVAG
jgi:hypothetical protein